MKRVIALYRVSTLKQVDQDDIPMQKIECRRFAEEKGWKIVKEFSEKGVSGFKTSISERDAIQDIRAEAEKKTFDVLLVFMFDRLGRREDEVPFLVEWFVSHGIEVWSTREGQQKIENRVDKLMNYIRYWQAGGESEKTSERVKTKHRQMTEAGLFRGGTRPFGYSLVHKGRVGRKNRPLYDLEINPEEAEIVREMFELCCWQGYGSVRLTDYLNEKYPNMKKWNPRSVMTVLQNSTYIGILHCGDTLSPVQEHLRIIEDSLFEYAQKVISRRVTVPNRHKDPENSLSEAYGAKLLSGLLYCGHCGHRLVGNYSKRKYPSKTVYRPIYRCYYGATHKGECDGKHTYSAQKVEAAVLKYVRMYFEEFNTSTDEIWMKQYVSQNERKLSAELKAKRAKLASLEEQSKSIKAEILKSLTGESVFDKATLQELLDENAKQKESLEKEISAILEQRSEKRNYAESLAKFYGRVNEWRKTFDQKTEEQKKMVLAQMIERITIDKDYNIQINFYTTGDKVIEKAAAEATALVEHSGFEPLTSSMRTRRSTN